MKKKVLAIILIILIICLITLISLFVIGHFNKENKLKEQKQIETKIKEIKSYFNENVITTKETELYKKEDKKYISYGKINEGVQLSLNEEKITEKTEYFHIKDLDLYVKYDAVTKSEDVIKDDRYKNYIPFNINVKTKDATSFYDEDDKYLFTVNESYDFVVIVKDTERYGVEYKERLLYVHSDDVEKTYEKNNTTAKNKSRIRTLTYHFIYNPETIKCDEAICLPLNQFESHLKYIRENNYFTLKLNELELYLDGKIQIPEKSIVLTIDDGTTLDQGALKLLEKYESNATLFLITGWISPDKYQSENLDIESHTHNMHTQYECPGYGNQGGGILCLPEEKVLADLKASQEALGGSKYFAYPFFDYNDRAIELLKKAGFKLAFIGQSNTEGYSYPLETDKYKVRRLTIFSDVPMSEFIEYLQ